jgi:hypothetical protein
VTWANSFTFTEPGSRSSLRFGLDGALLATAEFRELGLEGNFIVVRAEASARVTFVKLLSPLNRALFPRRLHLNCNCQRKICKGVESTWRGNFRKSNERMRISVFWGARNSFRPR